MPTSTLPNAKTEVLLREQRTLELRLAKVPFQQIADELGYADDSGAYRAYCRALKRNIVANVEELRNEELATLNQAQRAIYPRVLQGDDDAIATLLKIMTRRSKYLGLDHADKLAEREDLRKDLMAASVVGAIQVLIETVKDKLPEESRQDVIDTVLAKVSELSTASE